MKPIPILIWITLLIFSSFSSFAAKKYAKAEILLKTGDKIECVVQMPIYVGRSKVITYKSDWKTKDKQKVKAEEIEFLILKGISGDYTLKWSKYYRNGKSKLSRHPCWMEVRSACPEIITYAVPNKYEKSSHGGVYASYAEGIGDHMIQRPGEDFPSSIGHVFIRKSIMKKAADKKRKKYLEFYFANDPKSLQWLEPKKRIDQSELTEYLRTLCTVEGNE